MDCVKAQPQDGVKKYVTPEEELQAPQRACDIEE
jgi:hypothetical protein